MIDLTQRSATAIPSPRSEADAPQVRDFSPVVAALGDFARATGRAGLPLSGWEVATPGSAPPAGLVRRLRAIRAQPLGYTYSRDFGAGRERAAACLSDGMRLGGAPLRAQEIAILGNSSQGLLLALTALRERGIRRIIIAAPVYYGAMAACQHLGLAVALVPAADFVTGAPDVARLARAAGHPHSALLLTNPAYSIGVEYNTHVLAAIFAALPRGVPVLLDETRLGLHWHHDAPWYDFDFPPQTLILRSPSKIFGLNGMKMSVLVAPAPIIRAVECAGEALLGSVPGNGEAVALAYVAAWEAWLAEVHAARVGPLRTWKRRLIAAQRTNLAAWQARLESYDAIISPVDSGPYALVALSGLTQPIASLTLARERGILLMTSDYFYHEQPSWQGFRLNTLLCCPDASAEEHV